jgi:hypothetical protein
MDQSGRMRRIVLALIVGASCGALAYLLCDQLAQPDTMVGGYDGGHQARAFKFIFYVTGFVGMAAFITTLKIANWRADKKYRESLLAQARQIK